MAAAGMLPPKPRHTGCGLIPLPRLSADDHDDVTVLRLRGELDPSGMAVLHTQLRDIRWRARARSVADLAGLPVPGRASLSAPTRRCKPIRERTGNLTPGGPHAVTGTGATRSPVLAIPVQPTIPARGAKTRTGSVKCAIGAALRGAARYAPRRHVQPRHAHGLILGAYQRAVILAPCPASGLRRGTLYREGR
jgi:hypothetical protein